MANSIIFDFRHGYQRGERRPSEQLAYQWDLGHTAEIFVPAYADYEMHYCFDGYAETDDYAVESITPADDGGYRLIAHVPNKYFERSGELHVYIYGSADGHVITTYEGYIAIRERTKPEEYADEDPENDAESIVQRAHEFANQSEAWAVGEIDGEPVPATAPQYHNYSEYYAGLASESASAASGSKDASEAWATGKIDGTDVPSTAAQYHNNSKYYAGQASGSEDQAEAWATGKIDGSDVPATAPQYHNNAKYYAEQAVQDFSAILGDFATVETSSSASRAYKVGEYLIHNNLLYRVTTAISSGGTITPGTNCVQTTVSDEIANRVLWWSEKSVASTGGTSGTLMTISDTRITANHVLDKFVAANPSVITSDITCVTSAGQAVITGISTAATTAEIKLTKKDN